MSWTPGPDPQANALYLTQRLDAVRATTPAKAAVAWAAWWADARMAVDYELDKLGATGTPRVVAPVAQALRSMHKFWPSREARPEGLARLVNSVTRRLASTQG